jgi:hypothetical protein
MKTIDMEKFQLQQFLQIIGIGSASGLIFHDNLLYLISDNSSYLYEYSIRTKKLNKIALVENPSENIPKKNKADFESITLEKTRIFILGSGSTENRKSILSYSLKSKEINDNDFSKPYDSLMKIAGISLENLNIEGFIYSKEKALLFQRGNGKKGVNGIFEIKSNNSNIKFHKAILPKINNIEASFTDAILVDETIYFLASLENTISTYEDGEVLGTFLGKMKITDFSIEETTLISYKNKFEGITLYKKTEKTIDFLLCEDNDTEDLESTIYKLTINM